MYTVKLTFNYDWPIFRQTPAFKGVWGDYRFVMDDQLEECDFWVVYSNYKLGADTCRCNPANVVFLPAECYETSPKFSKEFLNQFGSVITVQRELTGNNIQYWQNANPWFVERSYDELVNLQVPEKTKLLSIVSSNKVFTEGHKKRLDFAYAVKEHFGDRVDMFGRGIAGFDQKWDVLAPYKYHIAIENDACDDWVTEKFFDPLLTYTYPFYYGCPNMSQYMPDESYTRIDINDPASAIAAIEKVMATNDVYNGFLGQAAAYRQLALNHHQLFPMLVSFLEKMDPTLPKSLFTITPETVPAQQPPLTFFQRLRRKIVNR